MLIGNYHFQCQFNTPALLPPFKGSTLRGGLGHALKQTACALRRQVCDDCLLQNTCAHAFLFETQKASNPAPSEKTKRMERPHPYILIPPADQTRHYAAGSQFSFGIKLFGRANDYLPHLLYAVELMGKGGLGRKQGTASGTFILVAVSQNDTVAYDAAEKILHQGRLSEISLQPVVPAPLHSLTVRLVTPLRLKHDNHFQNELPFHVLIRAALRRIAALESSYGNGEPALDYRGLVRRAEAVGTLRSDCRWVEYERYSNRQKGSMLIGGLTGTVEYEGELAEFLPLLAYCEQTHLGKQTSFGLGGIEVVVAKDT